MKTIKLSLLLLAAAVCVGGALSVNLKAADGFRQKHRPGHGFLLERAKEKLGLTEAQVTQVKAIVKDDKEVLAELIAQLRDTRSALRAAIHDVNATEASVRAAAAEVAAVESDLAVERLKLYSKISVILTPEQRERLAEMQERMEDFGERIIGRISERLAE
jgi:Spy/CpxP family protein refolding chaperone